MSEKVVGIWVHIIEIFKYPEAIWCFFKSSVCMFACSLAVLGLCCAQASLSLPWVGAAFWLQCTEPRFWQHIPIHCHSTQTLTCLQDRSVVPIFVLYINGNTQYVFLWVWFVSLTFLKCIHIAASLISGASLISQLVKNPPAMQEISVWFLGQEDVLETG